MILNPSEVGSPKTGDLAEKQRHPYQDHHCLHKVLGNGFQRSGAEQGWLRRMPVCGPDRYWVHYSGPSGSSRDIDLWHRKPGTAHVSKENFYILTKNLASKLKAARDLLWLEKLEPRLSRIKRSLTLAIIRSKALLKVETWSCPQNIWNQWWTESKVATKPRSISGTDQIDSPTYTKRMKGK